MRNHEIAVGWMHVVAGLFVLGCVSLLWVLAAQLAPSFEGTFVPELFKTFGRPIALVLLGLAGLQTLAAVALLRGMRWPRAVLMGVSLLHLAIFPVGTALSIYTFWALLYKPAPALQVEAVRSET